MASARGKTLKYFLIGAVAIENLTSATINVTNDNIEVTDFDSVKYKEYLIGDADATISLTCNYQDDNGTAAPAQAALIAAAAGNTVIAITYALESTAGEVTYTVDAIPTFSEDHADPTTISFDLQITGAPVEGTVPA